MQNDSKLTRTQSVVFHSDNQETEDKQVGSVFSNFMFAISCFAF